MRAPAAADEASHARAISSASVASRRICAGASGQLDRADEQRVRRTELFGRGNRARLLQNLRDRALDPREARGRAAGQQLDLLKRGLQGGKEIQGSLNRHAILPELRRAQRPPIPRQLKPAGRVEARFHGRDQRSDGFRTLAAELSIARGVRDRRAARGCGRQPPSPGDRRDR